MPTPTTSLLPPKKVLISFMSLDQDDFELKKSDVTFLQSFLLPEGRLPQNRHEIWRPSVALAMLSGLDIAYEDLLFDDYYLLWDGRTNHKPLLDEVVADIRALPNPPVLHVENPGIENVFDAQNVYEQLREYFERAEFHAANTTYYVNCTGGTTAIRNCLFLLTQMGNITALRIAPTPWENHRQRDRKQAERPTDYARDGRRTIAGSYTIENPQAFSVCYRKRALARNRSTYDTLSQNITIGANSHLTKSFDKLARVIEGIRNIQSPDLRTRQTILLTGETGVGKTQLAANITRALNPNVDTPVFIRRNCATLCGADPTFARIELFGCAGIHNGPDQQDGALKQADGGVLFLDEIGELPDNMQSMLLTALEEGQFLPVAGRPDNMQHSTFQLICGTNRPLEQLVEEKKFRRDLFNRINAWHIELPPLRDHLEDLELNVDRLLDRIRHDYGTSAIFGFDPDAKKRFLEFGYTIPWRGNFRELNAMVTRMVILSLSDASRSDGFRITKEIVEDEIAEAERKYGTATTPASTTTRVTLVPPPPAPAPAPTTNEDFAFLANLVPSEKFATLRLDERAQLACIVQICGTSETQAEAAKKIYAPVAELPQRPDTQLKRYLKALGLTFADVAAFARASAS